MIHRISDEHKINFLETKEIKDQKVSSHNKSEETNLQELQEIMKAKKLSNKDDGLMTTHHIRSAQAGNISDIGGPDTVSNTDKLNSIWDSDKIARSADIIDSKTRTQQEKETILENKRVAEKQRMDELIDNLKETDQRKDATISRVSDHSGSKYYSPNQGMSIFDTKEFERLSQQTDGERMSEEARHKEAQKDESWRGNGKSISSKEIQNKFFDSFFTSPNGE